jgi:hypothetical protein
MLKKMWASPAVVLYSWETHSRSYGMRREVDRFEAEADDGRRFTIIKSQTVVDNGTIDGSRSTRQDSYFFILPMRRE